MNYNSRNYVSYEKIFLFLPSTGHTIYGQYYLAVHNWHKTKLFDNVGECTGQHWQSDMVLYCGYWNTWLTDINIAFINQPYLIDWEVRVIELERERESIATRSNNIAHYLFLKYICTYIYIYIYYEIVYE